MDVAGLVKVRVQADLTELDRGFAEARTKSGAFDREASRAFRGVDAAVKDTGRGIKGMAAETAAANDNFRVMGASARVAAVGIRQLVAVGATFGAAALAAFSIQPVFQFKDALAEVTTLVDTATFDMGRLEKSALKMAAEFGGGATAQVQAFNDVISAGTEDLARATDIVETANKLAIGGAAAVGTATDGLTTILNAYGDKVENATAVSDALFIAVRDGKSTIDEMASSLGKVAPIAAQTNVSFDELTAAIAALTLGGISTRESVTGVRAMLAAIAKPTSQATKLAAQLGIEFNTTGLRAKGLVGFLDDLMKKTGGSTDALAVLFGGVEALVPAMALAGSAGDSFANTMENMKNKAGATEEAFNKMAASPVFQAGRVWSALQAEVIGVGGALSGPLASGLKLAADNMHLIISALEIFAAMQITSLVAGMATQFLALAAAMDVAAVSARALSVAMAFVGGPIGLAVGALAAAYLLLRDNVSAAEQATRDAQSAYATNEKALNDQKAASEGYTEALRNQIAMQAEAAKAAYDLAFADLQAKSHRRAKFEEMTGLSFAPFDYAEDVANARAGALYDAYLKLDDQLAKVDANMKKVGEDSGSGAGGALATVSKEAEKAQRKYDRLVDSAVGFIAEQEAERQGIGLTREAAAALRYEQDLLNHARRAGLNLTEADKQGFKALAEAMAQAEEKTRSLTEGFEFMKDLTKGFFSDFKNDLISNMKSGMSFWESTWRAMASAAERAMDKIIDKLLNDLTDAIFQVNKAGSSGGGGGIMGWLGKLFGLGGGGGGFTDWEFAATAASPGLWAKGGAFENGISGHSNSVVNTPTAFMFAKGAGIMGEAGPEGILPLRRNSQGQLGVIAANDSAANQNAPQPVYINVNVSGARGNSEISQMVERGVRSGIDEFSRKGLPVRVKQINADPRKVG